MKIQCKALIKLIVVKKQNDLECSRENVWNVRYIKAIPVIFILKFFGRSRINVIRDVHNAINHCVIILTIKCVHC